MDRKLKTEIFFQVRDAIQAVMEEQQEQWVTAENLCEQYQCFTLAWMKDHGRELPRTKAAYSNRWCYPLHKIGRLIRENKIRYLNQNPIIENEDYSISNDSGINHA